MLLGGCANKDPVAAEIACQKRMVSIPAARDLSEKLELGRAMGAAFGTMSRRYAAMDQDGCTDEERARLSGMIALSRELASLAPPPKGHAVPQFEADLHVFEKRREAMQQDLDRMEAVRLVK